MRSSLMSIVVVLLTGCYGYDVTVQTAPLSRTAYPPAHDRFVEVYFDDAGPARTKAHKQLCVIEVTGAMYTPLSELVFEMRKKAANVGADAVIQVSNRLVDRSRGDFISDFSRREGYQREEYQAVRLSGIAIVYL